MYLKCLYCILCFCCINVHARRLEKISFISKVVDTSGYLMSNHVTQAFVANAPHISEIKLAIRSAYSLKVSLYETGNLYGNTTLLDESNKLFETQASCSMSGLCQISFPDSITFNIGRKYLVDIKANTLFQAFIEKSIGTDFQLISERENLLDKRLNFEITSHYAGVLSKETITADFSYLLMDSQFLDPKGLDTNKVAFNGVVFRSHYSFLEEIVVGIKSKSGGKATIFEFDAKTNRPLYYAQLGNKLPIQQDSLGNMRFLCPTPLFTDPNKLYCLIFDQVLSTPLSARTLIDSSSQASKPYAKHVQVLSRLKGHDYYTNSINESVDMVFKNDSLSAFTTYNPQCRYLQKIVLRNLKSPSGHISICRKDLLDTPLWTFKFNSHGEKEAVVNLRFAIALDLMRAYEVKVCYNAGSSSEPGQPLNMVNITFYGALKNRQGITKIIATQLNDVFDGATKVRISKLKALGYHWVYERLGDATFEDFEKKVKQVELVSPQLGMILNFELDAYLDPKRFAAFKAWLERFTRKNTSRKYIYNFDLTSFNSSNYGLFKNRVQELIGSLKNIEEKIPVSEPVPLEMIDNQAISDTFVKYFNGLSIYKLRDAYQEQKSAKCLEVLYRLSTQKDSCTLPNILYDFSQIKELDIESGYANKIYDNYTNDEVKTFEGQDFTSHIKLKDSMPAFSHIVLRFKIQRKNDKAAIACKLTMEDQGIYSSSTLAANDSILKFRFFVKAPLSKSSLLKLKLSFDQVVDLFAIKQDSAILQLDNATVDGYTFCTHIAYQNSLLKSYQVKDTITTLKIGQSFVSEGKELKGLLVRVLSINKPSLSIYKYGGTKNPKGTVLLSGVLPVTELHQDHLIYYQIDLKSLVKGMSYYLEFSSPSLFTVYSVAAAKDEHLHTYEVANTAVKEQQGLCLVKLYSLITANGTLNLSQKLDVGHSGAIISAEQLNHSMLQSLLLNKGEAQTLGYVFSKDLEAQNRWGDIDHHGLYTTNRGGRRSQKSYMEDFQYITSFFQQCKPVNHIVFHVDKDGYNTYLTYEPQSETYKMVIWRQDCMSPLSQEDVISIKFPNMSLSEVQGFENSAPVPSGRISVHANELNLSIHQTPLYLTFKLKQK